MHSDELNHIEPRSGQDPTRSRLWDEIISKLRRRTPRGMRRDEHDDVIQETLVRVLCHLRSGSVQDLKGFSIRTHQRVCVDWFRSRARAPCRLTPAMFERIGCAPEHERAMPRLQDLTPSLMPHISARQRELLRYIMRGEGPTVGRLARRMGCSRKDIRVMLRAIVASANKLDVRTSWLAKNVTPLPPPRTSLNRDGRISNLEHASVCVYLSPALHRAA